MFGGSAEREEHAVQVHPQQFVPLLRRHLAQAGVAGDAGGVDQNVDAAKGVYGLVHGGLQLFLEANIPHAGQGGASRLADFLGRRIDGAR